MQKSFKVTPKKTQFLKKYAVPFFLIFTSLSHETSANVAYLSDWGSDQVYVIDTKTNEVTGTVDTGTFAAFSNPQEIAIFPDGRSAYVADRSIPAVYRINTQTNRVEAEVSNALTAFSAPRRIAVSPNGQFAYLSDPGSHEVYVINTQTNATTQLIDSGTFNYPLSIVFHPTLPIAYIADRSNIEVYIVDTNTHSVTGTITNALTSFTQPFWLAITSDGNSLLLVDNVHVYIINTATESVQSIVADGIPAFSQPTGIAAKPGQEEAYAVDVGNGTAYAININTNAVRGSAEAGTTPASCTFSPDGKFAYVPCQDPAVVYVFDTSSASPTLFTTITSSAMSNAVPFQSPFVMAIAPGPSSPTLTGSQKKNSFAFQYELVNELRWKENASAIATAGYLIYRNGTLIATLDSGASSYNDHNRPKGVSTTYSVVAFDANHNEGIPATLTLP